MAGLFLALSVLILLKNSYPVCTRWGSQSDLHDVEKNVGNEMK